MTSPDLAYVTALTFDWESDRGSTSALARRFPSVVVTAGGEGVAGMQQGDDPVILPALPVTLVSTHGAGDAFVGALVAALAATHPFAECLQSANAAAAAHVSARINNS